jgi:Family of unknown function (DUF5686)/CarboxypepD_reg-like domain
MRNKASVFLLFIFFHLLSFAQNQKLHGTVLEMGTKTPLAFVTVLIKENSNGKVTDIDGRFSFLKTPEKFTLKISYVGYETKEVVLTKNDSEIIIELSNDKKQLETVVIGSGENPALRIIRLLLDHKKDNNPELLPSYKYNAYTISTIGMGNLFTLNPNIDSTKNPKKTRSVKEKRNDSLSLVMFKKFRQNYLMVTESYIERKFLFPNRSKETVLASKVSGLDKAPFALTASSFQPFGFYKNYLLLGLETYVSPLINRSITLYNFRLKETLINGNDTSFIIQFEPRKNKKFKGLKGFLYINSSGYAIENVIASTAEKKGIAFNFRLQQQYEKIQGKWFPKQLNTQIAQTNLSSDSTLINWDSRSYLTNISIGDIFPFSTFSDVEQVFDLAAGKKTESEWKDFRLDSLTSKEETTYTIYENLPSKTLNKINRLNSIINALSLNAIPWGKVDIPFKYFINGVNVYEGIRVGGGLQTNQTFNKYFSLGAFGGYGLKDNAWKYGGNILFNLKERTATNLTFSYEQNLAEPGNVDYFSNKTSILFGQTGRKFLTARMDSIEQFKIDFTTKIIPSLQTNVWLQNEKRNPAGYDYLFENKKMGQDVRYFRNTEIGLGFRYTKGESFIKIGRAKVQNKPATTQFLLQISKGIQEIWNGDFEYRKIALQFNRIFNSKRFGQTNIQMEAGQIYGDLPYSYLFNIKASVPERKTSIFIPNTFQTVGLYEFASSQSVSLFFQNDFGNLLFKPKNILIRPTFLFVQGISFGKIQNATNHKRINFKTPNKGLYESGFMVKNIYRNTFKNLFYWGLGAGIFYRYGYYHLEKKSDNWTFKLSFNVSFN